MTSPERIMSLTALGREFYEVETTEERRELILIQMRTWVQEEKFGRCCLRCKFFMFYAPHSHALIEGHVYSPDGLTDATKITFMCEFCFDLITKEPEEED